MNIFQKICCRAFQFCFKIAIPVLPYRNGELYENVERIPLILREKEYDNVLIVTDRVISTIPVFKRLLDALDKAGILKVHKKLPFMIAVPTTAGTGSEVTVTTVITDEKTKHKSPISDLCLIPSVAVLDTEATLCILCLAL